MLLKKFLILNILNTPVTKARNVMVMMIMMKIFCSSRDTKDNKQYDDNFPQARILKAPIMMMVFFIVGILMVQLMIFFHDSSL